MGIHRGEKMNFNKRNICQFGLVIGMVVMTMSCASIVNGTKQDVSVSSSPTNANVTVDGKTFGVTPLVAQLKRKTSHTIKVTLPGYMPYEITLTKKMSGWVWGNLLIGGIVGLGVDAVSGGLYRLTPDQVSASLTKDELATIDVNKDMVIVSVKLSPDENWEKIGEIPSYFNKRSQ